MMDAGNVPLMGIVKDAKSHIQLGEEVMFICASGQRSAVACGLLDRQIKSLALAFENEGGFTERLYRVRTEKRSSRQTN